MYLALSRYHRSLGLRRRQRDGRQEEMRTVRMPLGFPGLLHAILVSSILELARYYAISRRAEAGHGRMSFRKDEGAAAHQSNIVRSSGEHTNDPLRGGV